MAAVGSGGQNDYDNDDNDNDDLAADDDDDDDDDLAAGESLVANHPRRAQAHVGVPLQVTIRDNLILIFIMINPIITYLIVISYRDI